MCSERGHIEIGRIRPVTASAKYHIPRYFERQ
jgi:hypothetical protein